MAARNHAPHGPSNNDHIQRLFDLVENGSAEELSVQLDSIFATGESVLKRESLLKLKKENGSTILQSACSRADGYGSEIVKLLVEKALGTMLDEREVTIINLDSRRGNAAIEVKLEKKDLLPVELLLEEEGYLISVADISEMSELSAKIEEDKRSKLADTIRHGSLVIAKRQIQANTPTKDYLMSWRHNDRSILHCACERGNEATKVVQCILGITEGRLGMGNEEIRGFIDLPYTPTNETLEIADVEDPLSIAESERKYAINIAIENGNAELAQLLILHGADVNLPKNSKNEAIRVIYKKLPEILTGIFETHLKWAPAPGNSSVKMRTVTWDFTPVTGCLAHDLEENVGKELDHLESQAKLLTPALHRNETERAEVLLHPLFLWSAASILFIIYICFPETFGWRNATLTNSTESTQGNPQSESDGLPKSERGEISWGILLVSFFVLWAFTLLKEIIEYKLSPSRCYYWSQLENWGQWLLLISLFLVFCPPVRSLFAALGMFLAGVLTLGQLNKTPCFGIYMEILGKVTWNIIKFFLFFCPLIATYAGMMNLLFPDSDSFFFPWVTAKVVTMMTGEVGYDELFHPDASKNAPPLPHPHVAKMVILFFDFTVIIVLQNLLISLTISDIPALKEEAELDHCSMKLEQIYLIEKFLICLRDKSFCCRRSSCKSFCCWSRWCKTRLLRLMVRPKSKPEQRFHDLPEGVKEVLKAAFKKNAGRFLDKKLPTGCGIYKPSCCNKYFNCFRNNKLCKCFTCNGKE